MLLNLHVKNLALIDEIEVDFMDHLNILTGETGAGKSIIIGSINAALGGKLSKDMVRDQEQEALIELLFEIEDERTLALIKNLDIPQPEDGQVLLSRKLINGRSVCKVNGENVTIHKIRELSGYLIDIHGQHEHQSLLDQSQHLLILDRFAKDELKEDKQALAIAYEEYKQVLHKLAKDQMDEERRIRELDFLQFELNEISGAKLIKGEDEQLALQYKKMSNAKTIHEIFTHVYQMTGYDNNGAGDLIGRSLKQIIKAAELSEDSQSLKDQLFTIDSLLNDFNREMADYMQDLTFDEESFHEIEERLNLINGLKVKYGNSIEKIQEYEQELQKKQERLLDYGAYMEKLLREKAEHRERILKICSSMTKIRKKAAKALTARIQEALIELNFLDVSFDMEFKEMADFHANGLDEACFVISTNPGQKLRPLHEVASGGELSRIMLAIKSVLADEDAIETLIFDEIDVGISGRTAQKVSERMAVIAKQHQVICITHLAQIAAMADTHYKIEKFVKDDKTVTTIIPMSEEDSILELARITGGVQITEQVLKSAREMKELAKGTKLN